MVNTYTPAESLAGKVHRLMLKALVISAGMILSALILLSLAIVQSDNAGVFSSVGLSLLFVGLIVVNISYFFAWLTAI